MVNASSFIYPSIRTRRVTASCTIAGINPFPFSKSTCIDNSSTSTVQAYRYIMIRQKNLQFRYVDLTKMENRCGECCIGSTGGEHIDKMLHGTCTTRSNDRYVEIFAESSRKFKSKTTFGSIVIHGCEQNLTRSTILGFPGPVQSLLSGGDTPPCNGNLPSNRSCAVKSLVGTDIDGTHHTLRTEFTSKLIDDRWLSNRHAVH